MIVLTQNASEELFELLPEKYMNNIDALNDPIGNENCGFRAVGGSRTLKYLALGKNKNVDSLPTKSRRLQNIRLQRRQQYQKHVKM